MAAGPGGLGRRRRDNRRTNPIILWRLLRTSLSKKEMMRRSGHVIPAWPGWQCGVGSGDSLTTADSLLFAIAMKLDGRNNSSHMRVEVDGIRGPFIQPHMWLDKTPISVVVNI